MGLFQKVLHAGEGRKLKLLESIVPEVSGLEPEMERRSDDELRALTADFRTRLDQAGDLVTGREARVDALDDLLPEAFAAIREAGRRTIGQRHFDVQLMGGAALHFGWVAEMKTGEGKTLVATLPAYLNALAGYGVHLVTVNDYLAAPRRGVDEPDLPVPRSRGRRGHPAGRRLEPEEGRVRGRHHVRDEQRVRVRLPARQHGGERRAAGAARRPLLRDRRRGRLDPGRRGADAADHLGPRRRRAAALLPVRARS